MTQQIDTINPQAWLVENMRLTAFLATAPEVTTLHWWEAIVGQAPESETRRPRQGTLDEQGPFPFPEHESRSELVVHVDSQRVDVRLQCEFDLPLAEGIPLPEAFDGFSSVALKWFETAEVGIRRIAFGATVLFPVPDQATAYQWLARLLPSVEVDEGSRDLFYQVNRPIPSNACEGLELNRLARWSAVRLESVQLQLGDDPHMTAGAESFAVRVEVDFNSSPTFDGAANWLNVWNELLDLGRSTILQGDVR